MKRPRPAVFFMLILLCSFSLISANPQETKAAKDAEAAQESKASQDAETAQETKANEAKIASAAAKAAKENGVSQDEMQNLIELKQKAPKVFIDCRQCDQEYIKTEVPFVNYVRDRKEADVHVLVTTQQTGSGGNEYTFEFIGLNSFSNVNNSLKYSSNKTKTQEEVRRGYTDILRKGLIPYVARTPISELISVSFKQDVRLTDVVDKWNFWVFSVGANGRLNGESQQKSNFISANFSANKITPDIKIRMGLNANRDIRKYDYEDEKYTSRSESQGFQGLFVKSLGEHWSAGMFFNVNSSTYSNLKYKISSQPAIEYNVFPYSQSTRRQLRILYKIGCDIVRYREITIFDKIKENLFGHSLSATLEIKEPWGSLSSSIMGSNYFHDFSKNRVQFSAEMSLRIFRGLNLNVFGSYEKVRDQLSLAVGEATLDEILLRRMELATDYQYRLSVGFSYTFGSIFSNVVNPRFGSGGHGEGFGGGYDH